MPEQWGERLHMWMRYRSAVRHRKWSIAYDALIQIEKHRMLYGE